MLLCLGFVPAGTVQDSESDQGKEDKTEKLSPGVMKGGPPGDDDLPPLPPGSPPPSSNGLPPGFSPRPINYFPNQVPNNRE